MLQGYRRRLGLSISIDPIRDYYPWTKSAAGLLPQSALPEAGWGIDPHMCRHACHIRGEYPQSLEHSRMKRPCAWRMSVCPWPQFFEYRHRGQPNNQ
jgi:hypothetical protein